MGVGNAEKAFALARIGVKVFPVRSKDRSPFPGTRGFYDATLDAGQIDLWFNYDHADATTEVGYATGSSGLFVLDLDRGKKNGKDGFASIAARGLDLGETHSYPTKSGGEHRIFQSDNPLLTPNQDHDGLEGVDIRAGGSYAVWWADEVPTSREAFSPIIPEWMTRVADSAEFSGEGFSGSVSDWLDAIPDDLLPSGRVREFMARIPGAEFGHTEMTDLAWSIVRLGSERETGVRAALDALRTAWLRDPYNTPEFRADFDKALRGAILKAGRVQYDKPTVDGFTVSAGKAKELGLSPEFSRIEKSVSETATETEMSLARREMFKAAADAGLSASAALGIITRRPLYAKSKAGLDSVWFSDGEPFYHEKADAEAKEVQKSTAEMEADAAAEIVKLTTTLATKAAAFSFLSDAEKVTATTYNWWGRSYLEWVKTRITHYNKPYHVATMWATLSTIASEWGKVPIQGADSMDCNLYIAVLGESSSGKSEAWNFGVKMIDSYFGTENSPIVGDTKKTTAVSLHRTLLMKDGAPALVYSDEVQSFFKDLKTSHWQGSILGDLSDYYGGNVPPKNMMNDKENSGKRSKALLTTYFTGIADMSLDNITLDNWRDGFFYRFIWGFGEPRSGGITRKVMVTATATYDTQMKLWADEFRRLKAIQEMTWETGRRVQWDDDALDRLLDFEHQLAKTTKSSKHHDTVFIPANGRFLNSVMKCATLVALAEASEKVKLEHLLVALNDAGPWHKSMMLAVSETEKDPFQRDAEKALVWIKRNALRQVGKAPVIQRSAVMREFFPNEIAERLLRQLTEEGWLTRTGDTYQVTEG